VVSNQSQIICIEFARSAGWDRDKADAWLLRYRSVEDHERTVVLQTPYRFSAQVLDIGQPTIRPTDWLPRSPTAAGEKGAFDFVAVPALDRHEYPRDGAGLELDLSAVRQADRLPVGLRQGLPTRGFVNYLEAQALIRRLESWQKQEPSAGATV